MATETVKKTFEELLADPEGLPTDPQALAALMDSAAEPTPEGETTGEDAVDEAEAKAKAEADAKAKADQEAKDKEEADAKAKADADAKAAADAKAKSDPDGKPKPEHAAGVLTKDGSKVIPYTVLAETRRREDEERNARQRAETALAEAQAQVTSLHQQIEDAKAGKTPDPKAAGVTGALREKIAALKEQVPEVGEVLDEVLGTVDNLQSRLDEFNERQSAEDERRQTEVRNVVQDTIDKNPVLSYWQNEKPDLFNEAVAFDKALRSSPNPVIREMSMSDRFLKVVGMVEDLHGKTELPEAYRTAPAPKNETKPDPKPDVKPSTEAKPGGLKDDKPITLSDLPGGAPPASGQKAIEEMTQGDIEANVNRMLDQGKGIDEILSAYR